MLAGGMALVIPTTVAVLQATSYKPPEDYTEDRPASRRAGTRASSADDAGARARRCRLLQAAASVAPAATPRVQRCITTGTGPDWSPHGPSGISTTGPCASPCRRSKMRDRPMRSRMFRSTGFKQHEELRVPGLLCHVLIDSSRARTGRAFRTWLRPSSRASAGSRSPGFSLLRRSRRQLSRGRGRRSSSPARSSVSALLAPRLIAQSGARGSGAGCAARALGWALSLVPVVELTGRRALLGAGAFGLMASAVRRAIYRYAIDRERGGISSTSSARRSTIGSPNRPSWSAYSPGTF